LRTFADVAGSPRDLRVPATIRAGWPPGLGPKTRIAVPNEKALTLPIDPRGYELINQELTAERGSTLGSEQFHASAALLGSPGFVAGLERPGQAELSGSGYDVDSARPSHNPRALATAVAVELQSGRAWGVARLVAVEGGLRPGSTLLLKHDALWARDLEVAEAHLASLLESAAASVSAGPEADSSPWRRVAVLLGLPPGVARLPSAWTRHLELVAGLRRVRLTLRLNPDSQRRAIVQDLRNRPPDALLIWTGGVADPAAYEMPYLVARPSGYVGTYGFHDAAHLGDLRDELLMHLREIAPFSDEGSFGGAPCSNWLEAAAEIRAMTGPHMLLSGRADSMLEANVYPRPDRMVEQMRALGALAKMYHDARGELGAPLREVGAPLGIEVAQWDKGLNPPKISGFPDSLRAEPHVKVDDYKSPANVGRIYFAIDRVAWRFVVDHIGLHDYA